MIRLRITVEYGTSSWQSHNSRIFQVNFKPRSVSKSTTQKVPASKYKRIDINAIFNSSIIYCKFAIIVPDKVSLPPITQSSPIVLPREILLFRASERSVGLQVKDTGIVQQKNELWRKTEEQKPLAEIHRPQLATTSFIVFQIRIIRLALCERSAFYCKRNF
jgi:hypothetical protein